MERDAWPKSMRTQLPLRRSTWQNMRHAQMGARMDSNSTLEPRRSPKRCHDGQCYVGVNDPPEIPAPFLCRSLSFPSCTFPLTPETATPFNMSPMWRFFSASPRGSPYATLSKRSPGQSLSRNKTLVHSRPSSQYAVTMYNEVASWPRAALLFASMLVPRFQGFLDSWFGGLVLGYAGFRGLFKVCGAQGVFLAACKWLRASGWVRDIRVALSSASWSLRLAFLDFIEDFVLCWFRVLLAACKRLCGDASGVALGSGQLWAGWFSTCLMGFGSSF